MPGAFRRHVLTTISGERRSLGASLQRGLLRVLEPFYAGVVAARNFSYAHGWKRAVRAARPVVCVGNLTTGGTGKTPVVQWLVQSLQARGFHPSILMRGYKASKAGLSDEKQLHQGVLGEEIPVMANPDRVAGTSAIIAARPQTDVIVLDDGFQHRRLAREVDLVLVDATCPFGFGHLLPRGLLREPMSALRRATAALITRADQAALADLERIESAIRQTAPGLPVYQSSMRHVGLLDEQDQPVALERLKGLAFVLVCGIGNPAALADQLMRSIGAPVETFDFPDHHDFDARQIKDFIDSARGLGASAIVTTEKDWVKLRGRPEVSQGEIPFYRLKLELVFAPGHDQRLLERIAAALGGEK